MSNEEIIAYFKECNEKLVSVAKDENVYDYEKQVIEADCMRRTFEANEKAIKALEQEPCALDDARKDFAFDVYNILDFLPTNNEANQIIDVFDRVTSGLEQEPILDKIRAEIQEKGFNSPLMNPVFTMTEILYILDKYKAESEEKK